MSVSHWLVTQRSVELCCRPDRAGGVSFGCVVLDESLSWEDGEEQETHSHAISVAGSLM